MLLKEPTEGEPSGLASPPEEKQQPMLFVDVNVTPGQPPERIVLFQA